jgi:GNAT superfamily N-acetyltransferase
VTYELDDDPTRLDFEVVWRVLSPAASRHRWRTAEQVRSQIHTAWRVVGAYDTASGAQAGFARALSDGICDAYLADVFVLPDHRGHGLGKAIVSAMVDQGPGAHLRWWLSTADAHGLYEQFGFAVPDSTMLVRPGRFPAV